MGVWVPLVIALLACFTSWVRASDYSTPSEEVGKLLDQYDSRTDGRRPHELGFGYYYQGDILLPANSQGDGRAGIRNDLTYWPNGIVPYEIQARFRKNSSKLLREAMGQFERYTCAKFVPKKSSDRIYLTIQSKNTGCFASLGRSDRNILNLQDPACFERYLGTPVHELMHVLGFYHEHMRPDRDDWIIINRTALQPDYQSDEKYDTNFGKQDPSDADTYDIRYNYGSVMHYTRYAAAARPGEVPTLVNKQFWPEDRDFGSETGLTPPDIRAINRRFRCSERSKK